MGNASGEDALFSGDDARLQTRCVAGLNVGGTAHLRPDALQDALAAVVALFARGALQEPRPAIESLDNGARAHQAIEARTACTKTLLGLSE